MTTGEANIVTFSTNLIGEFLMSEKKNEELAKSVIGFLDKYSEKLFHGVKSIYGKVKEETILNWKLGYQTYLDNVLLKYSYAKPFLSGNQPRHLDDFYIPLGVNSGRNTINETSIEDLTLTNRFAIIVANAGSGKTMLMRHLFVDTIKNKKVSHIPVFVELRELNNTELSLFNLIKKKLRDNKFNFVDDYIEKAFEAGHFALFLDGFDEVSYDKREQVNLQIQDLADKYNENYFVLSSRPDDSLYRWTLFYVWQVEPLTLEQSCRLVEKTSEEKELKEKFVKVLREELFETHKSFLANPLLLSIMLITYKDGANIPRKLSTFYERAYIALFERHDAGKGAFNREKLSKLDILDFKRVFAAFSFITYQKGKYGDFSDTEIYELLEKSIKVSGITFDKKKYIEDTIQALCLLVRDGLKITFTHRSFQEYFAVLYISQINNPSMLRKIVEKFFRVGNFTHFHFLFIELATYTFEKFYLIPKLQELAELINFQGLVDEKVYEKFLIRIIFSIRKNDDAITAINPIETKNQSLQISYNVKPYWAIDAYYFAHSYYSEAMGVSYSPFSDDRKIMTELLISFEDYFNSNESSLDIQNKKLQPKFFRDEKGKLKLDVDTKNEIGIQEFINNKKLFKIFATGNHILSMKALQDVFTIKDYLIRKHQQQDSILDEDW